MSVQNNPAATEAAHSPGDGGPFFHVGDRKGHVGPHGEDLTGAQILERVGLDPEKYRLYNEHGGQVGDEIPLTSTVHVKPGDHFRAMLKGTDYSAGSRV